MLWKDIVFRLRGPRNSVLALIVYQASPRDPLVLAGVVLAMSLLGPSNVGFLRDAPCRSIRWSYYGRNNSGTIDGLGT
jgi:hypothetical protein